ncbi:MAG TPA: GTPase domain-containing protein, partial [Bacteroidia bacterium]|nr:GTPase domain-containing protein [Bacteroidia bacterium]
TDTPGLYRESETDTARAALVELSDADRVVVVARADRALEELRSLLPVVAGKSGFVILTFADRLPSAADAERGAREWSRILGMPVFAVDARRIGGATQAAI